MIEEGPKGDVDTGVCSDLPTNSQLYLPLLQALQSGPVRPLDIYSKMAVVLGIPEAVANRVQTLANGRRFRPFERLVRWARQDLVQTGHISKARYGLWELTEKGNEHLAFAKPGLVITIFETENGQALWAEAESASAIIQHERIQSIITSPPYPIKKGREYGTYQTEQWLDWIVSLCEQWKPLLKPDGSLILNLGECFVPNAPVISLYQERMLLRLHQELGFNLAQRFTWYNPCKPPSTNWTTVRKIRVVNRTEQVYWLTPGQNPKARPTALKHPYSTYHLNELKRGISRNKKRPSGHGTSTNGFARNNGGALPDNLLKFAHTAGGDHYINDCKRHGLKVHPARMPAQLAEFLIKLTTDENDLVADFFGGSGTTGAACEKLNRRWLVVEKSLNYLCGASLRDEFYPPIPGDPDRQQPRSKSKLVRP